MLRALSLPVVVLLAAGTFLVPAGSAQAAWAVKGTGGGRAAAVTLAAPGSFAVACPTLSLSNPKLTWTASPRATSYDVWRKVGNAAAVLQTNVGTTSYTDNVGALSLVSVTYSVQARVGTNWKSPLSTAPAIGITLGGLCIL